jgi:CRISPR-associated endonuclease/helicase Cas3
MKPTKFQAYVQEKVKQGKSVLLVAPTGLGKTFAVTGDIQEEFCKTVYSVPLRALGSGIRNSIQELNRDGKPIKAVIHHGDLQESELFSEEVIVTTYDQVVCGVPGLPLSLPLKAGHAVAGALLMSRLVMDEVHLAWGISEQALSILLAIIGFRKKFGLQTIVLTATLPQIIAKRIADEFGMELIILGQNELKDDEGLRLREQNRHVKIDVIELKAKGKDADKVDYAKLDQTLQDAKGKRIYFANTVERLQETYDRLIAYGINQDKITVLHNRMPKTWRSRAESQVQERFGKKAANGDWILLTNQVAEAGLDISAPLVISDPAPVDTLIQRAGRCARWFREGLAEGEFFVIKVSKAKLQDWALPYQSGLVEIALISLPQQELSWAVEQEWIDKAWGIKQVDKKEKKDKKQVGKKEKIEKTQIERLEKSLAESVFALNLFDRAAQDHKPGAIAEAFREILSVEVAVEQGNIVHLDDLAKRDLMLMLSQGQHPETSSVSLGKGWELLKKAKVGAAVIRWENDDYCIHPAEYLRPGDVLIVPSNIAYLHSVKGLCFGDVAAAQDGISESNWLKKTQVSRVNKTGGKRQTLIEHTKNVMDGTYRRLIENGAYRNALVSILHTLEPQKDSKQLADLIAELARVAAAFHDLGKADIRWQSSVRQIDSQCPSGLIARTLTQDGRIGVPHTPPSYKAIMKTCELLIGNLASAQSLIQTIALAAARHHSSLFNPAMTKYDGFRPHPDTIAFVQEILQTIKAPQQIFGKVQDILEECKQKPSLDCVPLMLPSHDLFPIYALVGRAILLADREDAKGGKIEEWRNY